MTAPAAAAHGAAADSAPHAIGAAALAVRNDPRSPPGLGRRTAPHAAGRRRGPPAPAPRPAAHSKRVLYRGVPSEPLN